jgi:hypothetical protein
MIFLVQLSTYLVETGERLWLAGLVFGLAVSVKVVPFANAQTGLVELNRSCSREWFE